MKTTNRNDGDTWLIDRGYDMPNQGGYDMPTANEWRVTTYPSHLDRADKTDVDFLQGYPSETETKSNV